MSGLKSERLADLSGIYRLEFYKKQKKWKLSHEKMKPKPKTTNKKIFNTTYKIDSDTDEKQVVFNDDCLVTSGETVPIYPELDQNLSGSMKLTETPANTLDFEEQVQEEISPTQDRYMWLESERDEQLWSNAVQDSEVPVWQEAVNQEVYCDIGAGEGEWCEAGDPNCPMDSPVVAPPQWIHDRGELVDQVHQWAEPYYPPDNYAGCLQSRKVEIDDQDSIGSFTDFSRGAHLAHHSSEVELVLDTSKCTCDCTSSSLGRASESELRARAGEHVVALSNLFAEILLRNSYKMSNTTACLHCPSHHPALNADWSRLNPLSVGEDSLLSVERGRGRGRLRDNQPIIRIGMGRPYRCT